MKKQKLRISHEGLLLELAQRCASIEAHLTTLFMMQCQLFDHLEKSNKLQSARTVKEWSKVRLGFLNENLTELNDRLRELLRTDEGSTTTR